jgi:hypothetical protein
MFSDYEIHMYIFDVRQRNLLASELERLETLLQNAEKYPNSDRAIQRERVIRMTQLFRALLAEKARQEVVQEVRQDNTRHAENSSPSPAHDAPRRVGIWNILKQKITGSG